MQLKDEVDLLRRVPLFAGVAPSKLKLLAFTSDRVSYRPGDVLFKQGDPGDAAYVVLQLDFPSIEQAAAFRQFLETTVWTNRANSPGLTGVPRARVLVTAPAQ